MRGRSISLAAAVIGGVALTVSMFFTRAAGASDLQQALHYFGITGCSRPNPCIGGNNVGAGAGVSASSTGGVGLLASAKLAPAVQARRKATVSGATPTTRAPASPLVSTASPGSTTPPTAAISTTACTANR